MKKIIGFTTLVIIIVISFSCEQKYQGFNETDKGLYYKIHTDIEGEKPQVGNILQVHIEYGTEDSVIFDNRHRTSMPVDIPLMVSYYPGDINEGLAMMSKGDSATFITDAESFFSYTAQQPLPDFIEPGSELYFNIVLVDYIDREEYINEQERMSQELLEQGEVLAEQEEIDRTEYLEIEQIDQEPLESGLIYVEIEEGDGDPVEPGNTVKVQYEGKLLDGTVFDSSLKAGRPLEFTVGRGEVIRGWDEGLSLMNAGGKAKLIIPSYLAYGQQGVQNVIPPYSTLIFEVEVLEVE